MRFLRVVAALLAVGLSASYAGGAPAGGTATGLVRNATTGQPVPDAEVALVFIGPEGAVQVGRARSDARGRFAFSGLPDGRYLVQSVRNGVTYAVHAVIGGRGPVEVVLQVHDASDRVPLRISLLGIAVEARTGYVRVSEAVHLQNAGSQTFLGAVVFPLPLGAKYVTFHQGLHQPRVEAGAIVDRLIVRPGTHQVAYGYSVAASGEVDLGRRLPLPVERLELFTTDPAQARSPRLQQATPVPSEGQDYARATARAVPAGDMTLVVVGVPRVRLWPAPAAAAVLAGLLALGLAWAALREGSR
ncbi:MAG: carboxypeptidase regulatory-like domain-containing protein [Armatimonadetes bacterium]|nr:carboxypeptidase regulatory-like domain-containing protein [Armatimonadota bacterium]